jgi:hypothetical protein
MILSAYNGLTIEEIYKAFELEIWQIRGQNRPLSAFNADYISKILIKYKNGSKTLGFSITFQAKI